MEKVAQLTDPAGWQRLSEDERHFLSNLAAKLEPIVQIVPPPPIPFVLGFELLALGPNGENFPAVIKRTSFDPGIVRLMIALVALKTAETLRADATFGGQPNARNLLFTVNLDPIMLGSRHLTTFLEAYKSLLHNVVFEVNEDTTLEHIALLKELVNRHGLRFALDDINALSSEVREILANRAELTKVDFKTFQKAMKDVWNNPDSVVSKISQFQIPGKPLVIEGVQDSTQQQFLAREWERNRLGHLYGQGLNLNPGQPWNAWLTDLKDFGLLGGHILSSPLLAKVNRIIYDFLSPEHRPQLKRENRGDIFIFSLPGASFNRKEPIILGLLSDRKHITDIHLEGLDEFGYLIVKEPIRIGMTTRQTNIEQITINQLHGHLSAWSRVHKLGNEAIRDDRAEKYLEKEYTPAAVEIPDDATVSCSANGSPEEGRTLLFHWLIPEKGETNFPFCALLGDYGMGKTFLCRMFVRSLLERKKENPDTPVPLYLDMRNLPTWQEKHIPELKEMLKEMTGKAGFPDISIEGILAAVHQGHVLLIFDGFDEKAAHLTDAQSVELLRNIREAVPPGTKGKLLLTCRTHYFLNRLDERGKVRGGAAARTRDGYSQTDFLFVYLKPFDEKRIRQYLEKVLLGRGDEVFKFLKSVYDLTDLAQRPYLLSLITAHLTQLEALAGTGKRVSAADVYEIVVTEWMDRDVGKHLIPPTLKVKFMEELAQRMWAEARQEIHFEELQDWLQKQMKDKMPAVTLEDAGRADADLRTATFLVRNPEGNYRFAHRSFFEFFLARRISRSLAVQDFDVLAIPRLSREVLKFSVDLFHQSDPARANIRNAIKTILESAYSPQVSENAFLLKIDWDRLRQESSPQPQVLHLEGADLSGVDLAEVCLTSLYLTRANLEQANLTDALLSGNLCETNLVGVKARGANLSRSLMSKARLDSADFSRANLSGCNLKDAFGTSVFFQRADFTNALLQKASFSYARLLKAKISEKQIHQADLFRASMPQVAVDRLTLVPQIGHANTVHSVCFSPDGNILASGSAGNTVRLWDVATGRLICTMISFGDGRWVSYTPENIFDAAESALEFIWFCDGLVVYPAEEFASEFHRPEELQSHLESVENRYKPVAPTVLRI
ncbi:MAG: pentapeptide repeat-containing protein [Nitrospirota bacterium]